MKEKTKYIGIDVLKVMQSIVDTHVKHYQSDFDIDKETMKEAARKPERTDRIFIWMCRECGTWLLKEKDVFIKGTHEYKTFTYYAGQAGDSIHAFVVEAIGYDGNIVTGNLYRLNYPEYYEHVRKAAIPAGDIIVTYGHGQRAIPPTAHFDTKPDKEFGEFISFKSVPKSPGQLESILIAEKKDRNSFKEDYDVLGYEIYECPASPTENGKFYARTQLKGQADDIVMDAKGRGRQLFIKAVCSDGKKRYC